uniref:DnaJ (Hsp40) homolog, subfamily C, member 12 n=1 Tax=Schistosoma japonicum TaxID=6182 RepID=C1L7U0_SCHJA|nr:DnaJ (Hsp40) homolog, subfamily C, member 12 [Schistosoma japonicum]
MSTLSGESNSLKENFYDLLGVNKDSSEDQILYEYRIKVREFHPDKNSDPKSALFFQKIQKARKILTDRNLRQLYDTWLSSDLGVSFEEYLRSHKNFEEVFPILLLIFSVCTGIRMRMKHLGCWMVLQMSMTAFWRNTNPTCCVKL